jgi:hypothetical protein
MCIFVAQRNLEKALKLFLLLKIFNQDGKTKFSFIELQTYSNLLGFVDSRPLKKQIDVLLELQWIKKSRHFDFFTLVSFDNIRRKHCWALRTGFECSIQDISNIDSFIGAVIYTKLHKSFWEKTRRKKIARLKGCAYIFPTSSPFFDYKNEYAPIATTGIKRLFDISIMKASRLKNKAQNCRYISIRKNYQESNLNKNEINLAVKYCDYPDYYKQFKGRYYLQSIDLILPLKIVFRRLRKIT